MTNYKPFEKKLHSRFDSSTKEIAVKFLESSGLFVLETSLKKQPECYKSYDFYIRFLPMDRVFTVEVERKTVWTKERSWEYAPRGIHIPYRKANSKADLFIMVNNSGKTLLYTDMATIKACSTVAKNTTNSITGTRTQKEKFFELSIQHPNVNFYHYDKAWNLV